MVSGKSPKNVAWVDAKPETHPFHKMDLQIFLQRMEFNSSNPKSTTQTCLESEIGPLQIISAQSHQLLVGWTSNMW